MRKLSKAPEILDPALEEILELDRELNEAVSVDETALTSPPSTEMEDFSTRWFQRSGNIADLVCPQENCGEGPFGEFRLVVTHLDRAHGMDKKVIKCLEDPYVCIRCHERFNKSRWQYHRTKDCKGFEESLDDEPSGNGKNETRGGRGK